MFANIIKIYTALKVISVHWEHFELFKAQMEKKGIRSQWQPAFCFLRDLDPLKQEFSKISRGLSRSRPFIRALFCRHKWWANFVWHSENAPG